MQPRFERLTDDQWQVIKLFFNWQSKRKHDLRGILDAIIGITRTAAPQAHQQGEKPVLIRIETSAGHGAGKPTGKLLEEAADMLAFMLCQMKVPEVYLF